MSRRTFSGPGVGRRTASPRRLCAVAIVALIAAGCAGQGGERVDVAGLLATRHNAPAGGGATPPSAVTGPTRAEPPQWGT